MTGRTNLADGVQGQRFGIDLRGLEIGAHHLQHLAVDNQLLEGGCKAAAQPACGMQDQIGAPHQAAP